MTLLDTVKVSGKYQISVPAAARRQLCIKAGDRLIVEVRGDHLLLMREPDDWAHHLTGLHADVWKDFDTDEYLRRERDAWTD